MEVYAKRWRIENKFSELVEFFSLNSLSLSLMIRIHFDILMTFIADTLYHLFAPVAKEKFLTLKAYQLTALLKTRFDKKDSEITSFIFPVDY